MDPTACWYRICDALRDNDTVGAIGGAADLADWLGKGGFLPNIELEVRWQPEPHADDCPLMRTSVRNHVWSVLSFLSNLNGEQAR